MKFSNKEIKDLFVSWLLISIAFAILFSGGLNFILSPNLFFIFVFLFSLLTVGISFLLHELMHKYFAQKYGLWAEYRAFYNMLLMAIAFSFFGFIFAAPGAVFMQGRITKEKNGKISLAGPMTNIVLAFLFFLGILFIQGGEIINLFLNYGLTINSLLALFNLIPAGPFDGKKVYDWNKGIYAIAVVFAFLLFFVRFVV